MYDCIIIGAGPAGVSAGIYAERAGLKTLVLEKLFVGGQVVNTQEVENYPGFGLIGGAELVMKMEAHLKSFNLDFKREEVLELFLEEPIKKVRTRKNLYEGKTIIIATGASPRYLNIPGEEKYRGRGVSYCGTCDGALYRDKVVAVVGGGNTALEDAIFLSRMCSLVHLIHRRDEFRANKGIVKKLSEIENLVIHYDSIVEEIKGSQTTEEILIKSVKTQEISSLQIQCLFIAIGQIPANTLVNKLILDPGGYIITDDNMETIIKGVFAAGDNRANILKQIVTAAGEGALAAYSASLYLAGL